MKKIFLAGLLLAISEASCNKNNVNPSIETVQLNFEEERQISYLNSNGSASSFTIKFINAVENRTIPNVCSVILCMDCMRPMITYFLIKKNSKADTLSLKRLSCITDQDLSLDNSLIDKKIVNGVTIALSNTSPLTDSSNTPINKYFAKLLIQKP